MSLTSSCPARLAAGKSWLLIRSIVYFTSSAVNDAPSCQVTPLRSFSLQLRPSGETPPLATVGTSETSSGTKWPAGSTDHNGLNRFM